MNYIKTILNIAFIFFLSACFQNGSTLSATNTTEFNTNVKVTPETPVVIPTISEKSDTPSIWFHAGLPESLIHTLLSSGDYQRADTSETTEILVEPGKGNIQIGYWQYYLTVPFFCLQENMSSQELIRAWSENIDNEVNSSRQWVMKPDTLIMLTSFLGEPMIPINTFENESEILTTAWNDKTCQTWAVVPFEDLRNEWKIIQINDVEPFSDDPNCLTIPIFASKPLTHEIPQVTNFHHEKLTTLNMTGVTALVRATAATMEKKGVLYPSEEIGSFLRASDFTHISNEVSFADDCPFPAYVMDDLRFCSSPKYVALLEDIGVDIIELTGDHLEDWGVDALLGTLNIYSQQGWLTYGGGINLSAAREPLRIEHHGNKLMFIGCNAKSPSYAHADEKYPGTWYCDWNVVGESIKMARDTGYIPIVTIQHKEYDQSYPTDEITNDFRNLASQGAVIILGSQAHQPQTFDFSTGSFIHYGLGNLFFDQYNESPENRQAIIDHFSFYDNRLINTRLYTTTFVDWAKPRWMTDEERSLFLNRIFLISNWNIDLE